MPHGVKQILKLIRIWIWNSEQHINLSTSWTAVSKELNGEKRSTILSFDLRQNFLSSRGKRSAERLRVLKVILVVDYVVSTYISNFSQLQGLNKRIPERSRSFRYAEQIIRRSARYPWAFEFMNFYFKMGTLWTISAVDCLEDWFKFTYWLGLNLLNLDRV